jgi:hypothetical protein
LAGSLICYSKSQHDSIDYQLRSVSDLHFQFSFNVKSQTLIDILWPDFALDPERKDELWKSTCFEFFAKTSIGTSYWELNLSPSGNWNHYHFDDNRKGMKPFAGSSCQINSQKTKTEYLISGQFILPKSSDTIEKWGVSAVLSSKNKKENEYWSLAHPGPVPDFHNQAGWLERMRT